MVVAGVVGRSESEKERPMANQPSGLTKPITFNYHTLRSVNSPEDTQAGRRRYCGVAPANSFFGISTDENVRSFLGRDQNGDRRKSTKVNLAIRETLSEHREDFPLLNSGIVMVAKEVKVEDGAKPPRVTLHGVSIINGAQTQGVLRDYFDENAEDKAYPSVNFELIIADDEELMAEISIARNFQNEVTDLSIFGRQGRFDELEKRMQTIDPSFRLRKRETDFGDGYLDTEKLVQALTAMAPTEIPLPSAVKRKVKTPETIYRVYAYRHRSRCLADFAVVMDNPKAWPEAHRFFLDVAVDAWRVYHRLKGEQTFSRLLCVKGEVIAGKKQVLPDGVPDGIVFPMLSALSRFMTEGKKGGWEFKVPANFPWQAFCRIAMSQETSAAGNNPQTMGKKAECYVGLHGALEMSFATNGLHAAS
jgi:AIPR protein